LPSLRHFGIVVLLLSFHWVALLFIIFMITVVAGITAKANAHATAKEKGNYNQYGPDDGARIR